MVFKVIYSFALIGILLSIESCYFFRRPLDDTPVDHSWLIVNRLEQDIIFKVYAPSYLNVGDIKQDSIWLMKNTIIAMGVEPFGYLKDCIDSVGVYTLDGKTLKVWRTSEQYEDERPFFYKPFWQKREWEEGGRRGFINYEWTFELLPEDIKIKEQEEP